MRMKGKERIESIPIVQPVLIWISAYTTHRGILLDPRRKHSLLHEIMDDCDWSLTRETILSETPLEIKSLK